jgi:tetratricopeptide (TPR) repeat protein
VRRLEAGSYALEDQSTTPAHDPSRSLLGKPMPYVGRERELQFLSLSYETCVEEAISRAVLVIAAPGVGKSRLRCEFLRRLQVEGQGCTVLVGYGDPMHAGTAYGPLGEALRRWSGVEETAEAGQRRGQLAAAVGRHIGGKDGPWVAEFLGELCGLAVLDEQSPRLRAARQDPRMMSDQVTAAFVTWLRAECAQRPVLLILEDLHWGDMATVRLVDIALRELAHHPFFVLALARPEIQQLFPRLWEEREVQTLRCGELGRRASERLIQEALGAGVPREVVERITTQAGGNALYLEELIRAVAEGNGDELPETLLSMLQARFLRFDAGARRLLRAASVFGETFWRSGVLELLGHELRAVHEIDRWLEILLESEVIAQQVPSRFVGEAQFGFRHGLLRDAAYSLLSEEDRRQGHLRAGQFLERVGQDDPLALAEHYERGGALDRAAVYHARAALRALDGQDHEGAVRMAERAIACGVSGPLRGQLRGLQGWACIWSRQYGEALELAGEAAGLLPEGSVGWYRSMGALILAAGFLGRFEVMNEQIGALLRVAPEPGTGAAFMEASLAVVFMTGNMGLREQTGLCLRRMREVGARLDESEAYARGLLYMVIAWYDLHIEGDVWAHRCHLEEAIEYLSGAGDQRHRYVSEIYRHVAQANLGEFAALRSEFRGTLARLDRLREPMLFLMARVLVGMALIETGERRDRDEARGLAEAALARSVAPDIWTSMGYVVLARVHAAEGDLVAAETVIREALDICRVIPLGLSIASPVLIRILLQQGRIQEAQAAAVEGLEVLARLGGTGWMDVRLYVAGTEAFHEAGDHEAAWQAAETGWGLVERRAAEIPDMAACERFLALPGPRQAREWAERYRDLLVR